MAAPRSIVIPFHDLVRKRLEAGVSCRSIAKEIGINYQSVMDYAKKQGFPIRPCSRKLLGEYVEHNGKKYTWTNKGFWRCTSGDRGSLAHIIYKEYHPEVVFRKNDKVQFANGDRKDFSKENLKLVHIEDQIRLNMRDTEDKRLYYKALGIAGLELRRLKERMNPELKAERIMKTRAAMSPEKDAARAKKVWATRKKNAEQRGYFFTEEQRRKMSESHKGKPSSRKGIKNKRT